MTLQVTQHTPTWFSGKAPNLMFFGQTEEQVHDKYLAYLARQIDFESTADKLIDLESQFNDARSRGVA